MTRVDPELARRALVSRLRTAATVLLPDQVAAPASRDHAKEAARLLDSMVRQVRATGDRRELWLLFVAVAAAYPTSDDLIELDRAFALSNAAECSLAVLTAGLNAAVQYGAPQSSMRLVTDSALVDVDFSARHELHTGIQRVVRSTVPLWVAEQPATLAAWTSGYGAYRELSVAEADRIQNWGDQRDRPRRRHQLLRPSRHVHEDTDAQVLLVPWGTAVVLAEVPDRQACDKLAALGRFSPNTVAAIGYDCIPIVSADLLPAVEGNKFVRYLSALKFAHSVAGISASATAEFAGFASMLAAQGLTGPVVFEVGLPAPAADLTETDAQATGPAVPAAAVTRTGAAVPIVLCVGSFEPRKNQIAVLHAAELLWRAGLTFSLQLVGGGGSSDEMRRRVAQLSRAGRRVSTRTGISEAALTQAYRQARFTVFPSLHEGYGLPVVESLAQGTPVITTNYGSPAEIGAGGGTVLIDPRDDRGLADAMRSLLTDDHRLNELRSEIARRPGRSWSQYAQELWQQLTVPAMDAAQARLPAGGRGGSPRGQSSPVAQLVG